MTARRPAPPRPVRRRALGLPFPSNATIAIADRRRARLARRRPAAAFEALRGAAGRGRTCCTRTYIDLRAAQLGDDATRRPGPATAGAATPAGRRGRRSSPSTKASRSRSALSPEAARRRVSASSERAARRPIRSRRAAGDGSLPANDQFAQLTRALWTAGMVLDVPAGVVLDQPIIVRWSLGAADRALFTRTFIRLGDGAAGRGRRGARRLPAERRRRDRPGVLLAGTTEVALGAGATLCRSPASRSCRPTSSRSSTASAEIGEDASLQWALAQLGGTPRAGARRTTGSRAIAARSSRSRSCSASDDQLFDLTSYTRHVGRDTTGDLLSKGALLDGARAYLKGLITIEKSAIGTDSFLGEFGMNLSKQARSVAIPSLEIDQPDCRRAAHASSVGPIDETQLFYLESRGASRRTRPASSSSSGSSSRSWPACRWPRPRSGCGTLLEAKWDGRASASRGSAADAA